MTVLTGAFEGAGTSSSAASASEDQVLQRPDVSDFPTDAGQISGHRVARIALASSVEVDLAGLRIAHQRINRARRADFAAHRKAVYESGDIRYIGSCQIELRHTFIWAAVLNDRRDQFAILVRHYQFAANQIRAALAASRVRSVAEAAVDAENLFAVGYSRWISWRANGIIGHATSPAARSVRLPERLAYGA